MVFFIVFLLIPFVEIGVFIAVGEEIGLFTTLALAFLTAILGGAIIRYQGLQTFLSFQNSMRGGAMPVQEIFDGFCLVAAGALLITPGFVTDTIGFLLLVPKIRAVLRTLIGKHMEMRANYTEYRGGPRPGRGPEGDVIDADYEDLSEKDSTKRPDDKRSINKS